MLTPRSWLVALAVALAAALGCENPAASRPLDCAVPARDAAADCDAGSPRDARMDDAPAPRLARNIIVFMGDGMGAEQLATGRFARGGRLRLDALAGPALAATDSLTTARDDGPAAPATDSAAAATVIATGRLVDNDVLSVLPSGAPLETVLEACKRAGKATGLVTTSTFFDASPAAFAVHQASRGAYAEIARELLGAARPDVVMGAGAWLVDDPTTGVLAAVEHAGYRVVRGAAELEAWDPVRQPRVLGLFATTFVPVAAGAELFTMTPELERSASSGDPSLATMTRRALERLSRAPDGFFLFAEDELFDQISHRGPAEVAWANRALPAQAVALDAAVSVAVEWVLEHSSFDETLIVVLADHETGGYHFDHELGPESGDFAAFSIDASGLRVGLHTRAAIEVYALGPGSDALQRVTRHADTHRLLLGLL